MSKNLLDKLIADEISLITIEKWLIGDGLQSEIQCSRIEFITYFLNFLHSKSANIKTNEKQPNNVEFIDRIPPKLESRMFEKKPINIEVKRKKTYFRITPILINKTDQNCMKKTIFQKVKEKEISTVEQPETPTVPIDETDNKIINKNQINILIDLYCYLFENNFIIDVLNEIKFLVSFLSLNKNDFNTTNNGLLNKAENCLYFTANSLMQLLITNRKISYCFDYKMLNYLYENLESKTFIRRKDRVRRAIEQKMKFLDHKSSTLTSVQSSRPNGSVCHFDTDFNSSSNFPNSSTFSSFCKQRDLFFTIFEEWSSKRFENNWTFKSHLSTKTFTLLTMNVDLANLMHLARLFMVLLLKTCQYSNIEATNEDGSNITTIQSRIDPQKFQKLQKRLTSQNNTSNIQNEHEEFFFEFLKVAIKYSYVFIVYLIDNFVVEIQDRFAEFQGQFESESSTANDLKLDLESFCAFLKIMKLLAKFLGFIDSTPFGESHLLSYKVFEKHKTLKFEKNRLSIDVLNYLKSSRLILTIPWISTYLSMFQNGIFFPNILKELLRIYSELLVWKINRKTSFVLQLYLGELFEKLQMHDSFFETIIQRRSIEIDTKSNDDIFERLINEKFYFDNFPILFEIRKSLCSNLSNTSSIKVINPIKCIKPTPAATRDHDKGAKDISWELEDSFLNMHPVSMRKTVDFVSDRISSACIKLIFSKVMPPIKLQMDGYIKSLISDHINDDNFSMTLALKSFENTYLPRLVDEFTRTSYEKIEEFVQPQSQTAIESLISTDTAKKVIECCVKITTKRTTEKILKWVQTQSSDENFLMKSFKELFKKNSVKIASVDKVDGRQIEEDKLTDMTLEVMSTFWSPSAVLIELQDVLQKIYFEKDLTFDNCETLNTLLDNILLSLQNRSDFNGSNFQRISASTVEIYLGLITNSRQLCTVKVFEKFKRIWIDFKRRFPKNFELFDKILSPRNIHILNNSKDDSVSCNLANLIADLISLGLLSSETFEAHVLAVVHCNNTEDNTDVILKFIQKTIKVLNGTSICETDETMLNLVDRLTTVLEL